MQKYINFSTYLYRICSSLKFMNQSQTIYQFILLIFSYKTMKIQLKPLILLFFLVIGVFTTYDFSYNREFTCISKTDPCTQWNQTTQLYRYGKWTRRSHESFHEETIVQTPEGHKMMKDLRIHDQVLSLNHQTGKHGFSQVLGWLHRSPNYRMHYLQLQTEQGHKFILSENQNVAHQNEHGMISFVTANHLKEGSKLYALNHKLTVKQIHKTENKENGIYAPYIEHGAFFIFPTNHKQGQQIEGLMVHNLENIQNPMKYNHLLDTVYKLSSHKFLNHEQSENDEYSHLINHYLNFHREDIETDVQHLDIFNTYGSDLKKDFSSKSQKTIAILPILIAEAEKLYNG